MEQYEREMVEMGYKHPSSQKKTRGVELAEVQFILHEKKQYCPVDRRVGSMKKNVISGIQFCLIYSG